MADNQLAFFSKMNEASTLVGVPASTQEERKALANAVMSPTGKLGDFVNMEITLKNFYMEKISMTTEDGELRDGYRTVLIDAAGNSYATSSTGVANSLKTIISFFGTPENWGDGLPVIVKQINTGSTRVYSLQLA